MDCCIKRRAAKFSLFPPVYHNTSSTLRCGHVDRARIVCQYFYGMSLFKSPDSSTNGLVEFNFYIGVLALSADFEQPVRHCRSHSLAFCYDGSARCYARCYAGCYPVCWHCVGLRRKSSR